MFNWSPCSLNDIGEVPGSVEDPVGPGRNAALVTGVVVVAEQVVLVRRRKCDVTLMESLERSC